MGDTRAHTGYRTRCVSCSRERGNVDGILRVLKFVAIALEHSMSHPLMGEKAVFRKKKAAVVVVLPTPSRVRLMLPADDDDVSPSARSTQKQITP